MISNAEQRIKLIEENRKLRKEALSYYEGTFLGILAIIMVIFILSCCRLCETLISKVKDNKTEIVNEY